METKKGECKYDKPNPTTGRSIGGRGAFTQIKLYVYRNQSIYAFVGSAGAASQGDSCAGGYNGGGPALVCTAGPHGASGGGATHISYANNPIISDVFVKVASGSGTDTGLNSSGSYSYDTIVLHYGKDLKGATQADLIKFVRDKLRSTGYYKNYVSASTVIEEVGQYHSYNAATHKTAPNARTNANDKPAWFLVKCATWNNRESVIAVAGGGGGGADCPTGSGATGRAEGECVFTGQRNNLNGKVYGYAGVTEAHPGLLDYRQKFTTKAANNDNAVGYNSNTGIASKQGAGQYCMNSSGGGAGWRGGFSLTQYKAENNKEFYQTHGGHCRCIGGGGTCYIHSSVANPTDKKFKIDTNVNNTFSYSGSSEKLDSGTYMKPVTEGINGYIKVIKH